MIQLEQEMIVLRRLFEPWNTAPHGTAIWEPEATDPNAEFKRDLIAKAFVLIAAGDCALAGNNFSAPNFGELSFSLIQDALATDPEERNFIELAVACERVRHTLTRVAT
jgi:hypothetical protein